MAETQPVVGRQPWWWGRAEVVLGAPPLASSRWGQIFGESVAMGTGRFGKGELKGVLKMQVRHPPPQAAITMTTSTILGRGRRGGVSDGRVGAWQASRVGRAEEGVES